MKKLITEAEYIKALKIVSNYQAQIKAQQTELNLKIANFKKDNINWDSIFDLIIKHPYKVDGIKIENLKHAFDVISEREASIISTIFDKTDPISVKKVAEKFDIGSEQVRRIKYRAIRNLHYYAKNNNINITSRSVAF